MRSQTVSSEGDQYTFRLTRSQIAGLAPDHDPRMEALARFGVIVLLSLGLWSAFSLAVFLVSSTVW